MFNVPPIVEKITNHPLSSLILAAFTIALLFWNVYKSWRKYRQSSRTLYLVLTITLLWLILAQISQYEAPIWQFSWWIYHIAMLAAYLLTMTYLITSYEKASEFSLTRYYASLALVLSLPMAFLLGEFSVTLAEREDLRWTLVVVYLLSLFFIVTALFALIYRAQQILNTRRELIEQQRQWRIDMTNMLAHDLMSPLNSIILDLS